MRNIASVLKGLFTPKRKFNLKEYNPSNIIPETEVVSNIELWGAQQAQKHNGSMEGLINSLKRVERGYIVEAGSEKSKQDDGKKQYRDQIGQNEKDISSKYNHIENIEGNKNPYLTKKIEENKEEINSLELDKEKSVVASNYSSVKNYFLLILVIFIGLYLIMFYASAINASLFTNIGDKLANVTSDNVSGLFVSIFDTDVFTVWTAKSIFIYIGAVLFIGIGFLPHTTDNILKKIFFYTLPLAVDAMLAYKIESNIYESKVMTGLAEPNMRWIEHFSSVNFWLVVAFGYVAYFVWGQLWDAWTRESEKKDAAKMAFVQIISLKKRIKDYEEQVNKNNQEINALKSQIDQLNKDIERLKNEMNYVVFSRNDLSRKLATFMDGWLKYISTDSEFVAFVPQSETTYKEFMSNINLN